MNYLAAETPRILSLDVFRGLTVALMVLVNSPGNQFPYPVLSHAPWNGCTLADLVFPFFLFIVGMSSVFSLNRYNDCRRVVYDAILKRSLILFLLGLALNIFPNHFDLSSLRVYGVLQRIAVCYLVASCIYLNTTIKTQILMFLGILWGYCCVMTLIPVPGFGANQLTEEGSWVAYWDQMLFSSKHLLEKVYDPEGFLSTIPAIATTLAGMLVGTLLIRSSNKHKLGLHMLLISCLFLLIGALWNFSFPINKNLWTSSYVLWSGGWALLVFSLCFFTIDVLGYKKWAIPLRILGMNALVVFILHVLLLKLQHFYHIPLKNGDMGNISSWITDSLFGNFSISDGALLYAVSFLCLNFLIALFLYKRNLFIRL